MCDLIKLRVLLILSDRAKVNFSLPQHFFLWKAEITAHDIWLELITNILIT